MTNRIIYRVQFTGLDVSGAATTFNYATEGMATSPSRTNIPNTFVDGRLDSALVFSRDMFGPNQTRGSVSIVHGTITLINPDGALDFLGSYGFDGRDVWIYRIDASDMDTDIFFWRGNTESVLLTETALIFTVREYTYALDVPLQPLKYAGTNVLPAGLEGGADNIKGKPKPVWLGTVWNVTPPIVNTSRLIYQLCDKAVLSGSWSITVYDSRVALTLGMAITDAQLQAASVINACTNDVATPSTFTTMVDLNYTNPKPHGLTTADRVAFRASPGVTPNNLGAPLLASVYYFVRVINTTTFTTHPTAADATANTNAIHCTSVGVAQEVTANLTIANTVDYNNTNTSGGIFLRIGAKPVGPLTVDCTRSNTATLALALQDLTTRAQATTGVQLAIANTVGVAPNPAIANQAIGIYVTTEMKVYEVVQKLCTSLGASFAVYGESASLIHLATGRIEPSASVTAILTLTDSDIISGSFKRIDPGDPERGTPAARINLNYKFNYTVQTGTQIAGGALDPAFVQLAYRSEIVTNTAILAQFPAAPQIAFDTLLADEPGAALLAAYYIGPTNTSLYSRKRDIYIVKVPLSLIQTLTVSLANSGGPALSLAGINGLVMGQPIALALTRITRTMYLIGCLVDVQSGTVQLTLWG